MKVKFLLAAMDKQGRWQKVRIFEPRVSPSGAAAKYR